MAKMGIVFDEYDPNILKFIAERSYSFWQNVSKTTLQKLRDTLSTSVREGWTRDRLAEEIGKRVFGDTANIENHSRAKCIAQTETTIVANQATDFAYQQSGVVRGRIWLTVRDGRVRSSHMACEAQGEVPLDGFFVNGLRFPGDPNGSASELYGCRCCQAPVVKTKEELE